jgi:cytoskeletal protein RodZ
MHSGELHLATLGDMLRAAREARGASLADAERETKIRQKYISALEDDNVAALPGPVYARGFLRNYAQFLALNPDEVVDLYDQQSQPTREKIRAARGSTPKPSPSARANAEKISIQPLSSERIDTRVRYGTQYIALSLLAIPLIIVFYFVYSAYAGPKSTNTPIPTITARPATVTPLPATTVIVAAPGNGEFNTPTVLVPTAPQVPAPSPDISATAAAAITPTLTVPVGAANDITVKIVGPQHHPDPYRPRRLRARHRQRRRGGPDGHAQQPHRRKALGQDRQRDHSTTIGNYEL